jgi:hypothetical protein
MQHLAHNCAWLETKSSRFDPKAEDSESGDGCRLFFVDVAFVCVRVHFELHLRQSRVAK